MKTPKPSLFARCLAVLASGLCVFTATKLPAAFVYESPTEFFSAGDFNGDGIVDVLVFDKTTGNARVGYSDGNGGLTWSAPLVTGVENATGLGVERFLAATKDSVAVTAPNLNHVNLVDLSQTNSAGAPNAVTPLGIGPHAVTGLASPQAPNAGGLPFLLIASSLNSPSSEQLDFMRWSGAPLYYGLFGESNSFERLNELNLDTNTPTFAVGLARGATNDQLHVWQFTNSPAVMLVLGNLLPGGDYAFGNFNGEMLPRFVFYQRSGSNLTIVPLLQTNGMFAFGSPLAVSLTEALEGVVTANLGANGCAIIEFADGVRCLTLPGGSPVLSSKYQTGAGAAGNVFAGVVPLTNGMFALLDAPAGAASSTHAQVIQFDGTNFTQRSASNLPGISSRTTRANVWLFQLEPFVNRSPGFIASLNSPDWADGVTGLPSAVQVPTEADAGATNGLGSVSTNNLGAPPSGSAFGMANQYNSAISVFSYTAPRASEPVTVVISPPPGSYGSPLGISFAVTPSSSGVRYRNGTADSWHAYSAQFFITNDAMIQFYGTNALGARSSIQTASYSLGGPATGGTGTPVIIDPGNTNTAPNTSTNQLIISQDGTVFYGRRSAANVGTIWAINLDGSGDTYITTGARPRVTVDGRWLAFLREGNPFANQGNVWIRDLTSGVEQRVFTNPNYITGYDWETNETTLLMDYSCGIWDLNTNGTLTALINADCFDDAPVRNPTDGRIAFHNLNTNSTIAGLYVADAGGNGRQRIVSSVPGASWPAWSPNGADLVFCDNNTTNADAGKNLWLVYPDGSGLLQISGFTDTTNGFPHGAIWSPDDSTLVSAGTVFGTNGLWLIPLTPDHAECDGAPILLPTSPGDAIDFAGSIVVAPPTTRVVTQAPGLFIRQDANAVVVYWSTNYVGFDLQSANRLPASGWTTITGPYYLAGGYYEYAESKAALQSQKYFRLAYEGVTIVSAGPMLSIQVETNSVVITWPTVFAGFALESKTNLSTVVPWNPVVGPYTINGVNFEHRESIAAPNVSSFYRLRGL